MPHNTEALDMPVSSIIITDTTKGGKLLACMCTLAPGHCKYLCNLFCGSCPGWACKGLPCLLRQSMGLWNIMNLWKCVGPKINVQVIRIQIVVVVTF